MICFVISEKKKKLFWAGSMGTPFLHRYLGNKCLLVVIFRGFSNFFFTTTGFQLKLLILIESPDIFHWEPAKKIKVGVVLGQYLGQIRSNVVKKVKKQALSIVFFHILNGEYLLHGEKQKNSGCTNT